LETARVPEFENIDGRVKTEDSRQWLRAGIRVTDVSGTIQIENSADLKGI
jgi:hypothetical protein